MGLRRSFHFLFHILLYAGLFQYSLCNPIVGGVWKLALGRQGRRSSIELTQDGSGKGQDPGLGPSLLCALGPAAAPLRAEVKYLPLCVLVEVGSRACPASLGAR